MTSEELPSFRYHPNPVGTGSIVTSPNACASCGRVRGFIYVGPTYGIEEHQDDICPWCIADGTARTRLNVEFTDAAGIGGYGAWSKVPTTIREEVAHRTPGFTGWQQERWF